MERSTEFPVLLFSYGTLQDKAVQLANFGRELVGQQDADAGVFDKLGGDYRS